MLYYNLYLSVFTVFQYNYTFSVVIKHFKYFYIIIKMSNIVNTFTNDRLKRKKTF